MSCLTPIQIENALLSSEDATYVEEHLEVCQKCRARVEESVGTEADWNTACGHLVSAATEFESADHASARDFESSFFYRVDIESEPPTKVLSSTDSVEEMLDAPGHPENLGRIGRYEIERTIGRGGMGVVFKGFDAELNRPVAIKILSPHLAGHGTARQRFAREAKAAAAVVHDNVVPIFDIQAESDRPYIVMPFVNGVSLQDYVDHHGQLGVKNLLRVALQVASGLTAAHAQGLIHRDIKPGNILLENGLNRVQITDFGLARAVDDAAMTHSSLIAGTPQYMSPEQAKGATLDHRSDLFSLGCVMYFMATGRALYRGDGPYSVISQLCKGQYTSVRELNPDIPAFVADMIDKLLEIEPQHRFQSAQQLVHHLQSSLAYLHQPTANRAPQKIWSSRRKRFWRRAVGIGSVVLLGGLVLGICLGFRGDERPNQNHPPQQPYFSSTDNHLPNSLQTFHELESELSSVESQLGELEQLLHSAELGRLLPAESGLEHELTELTLEVDQFLTSDPPSQQPEADGSGQETIPYQDFRESSGDFRRKLEDQAGTGVAPNGRNPAVQQSNLNQYQQDIDASAQLPYPGKSQNKEPK